VEQHARFVPRGIAGRAYWTLLWPVHATLFPFMLRRVARAAESAADAPD
jgi:hypothetical protein